MHWEARLRRLAALQAGVIGVHQMANVGGDHRWWANARRNGRWEPLSAHILRADGAPATVEQRAFAGVLDAGPSAFLADASALAWFGARARSIEPVQVARRRSTTNRSSALSRAHRLRDVRACSTPPPAPGPPTVGTPSGDQRSFWAAVHASTPEAPHPSPLRTGDQVIGAGHERYPA